MGGKKNDEKELSEFDVSEQNLLSGDIENLRLPIWPRLLDVSGLYEYKGSKYGGSGIEEVGTGELQPEADSSSTEFHFPIFPLREEVRLDVDGPYPQHQASGTVYNGLRGKTHWIAKLKAKGSNRWIGKIWYKDGSKALLPYTYVTITAKRSWYVHSRQITVTFGGGGFARRTRTYRFKSKYFHPVEFEYDRVSDVNAADMVTSINTHAHPNRPASLPNENLSIEDVYRRSGFGVSKSGDDGVVPISEAMANSTWSDMEMHDAMQNYWSRFDNKAQWSMWTLFAGLHDWGNSLGGIMFDSIGPNHRQGTALFINSFISQAPAGDPAPAAWVDRMRFWTACHEMGHAFNLAHSWQKAHPPEWGTPWIPLANEPEARSFMNYPYNVSGGSEVFFSDFEFRFSNNELLFMRHAPSRFVQMGNADWFDHHGFERGEAEVERDFSLQLRVNRDKVDFEFLESVVLELKLTNISSEAKLVDKEILSAHDEMTIIIKKENKAARQWTPFARYCQTSRKVALSSGQSLYNSLFISSGLNGWDIAEPGNYIVQMALDINGSHLLSNPLKLRVLPPRSYDEECCAQDFFTEDVGRIMTFDGSRTLHGGNEAIAEIIERLPETRAASHARVALSLSRARNCKVLHIEDGVPDFLSAIKKKKAQIKETGVQIEEAKREMTKALFKNANRSAETLGHVDYKYYSDTFAGYLTSCGDKKGAQEVKDLCYKTLTSRLVPDWVFREEKAEQPVSRAGRVKAKGK